MAEALLLRYGLEFPWRRSSCPGAIATACSTHSGLLTGGFGFVNYVGGSTFLPPRQGTAEMRFSDSHADSYSEFILLRIAAAYAINGLCCGNFCPSHL